MLPTKGWWQQSARSTKTTIAPTASKAIGPSANSKWLFTVSVHLNMGGTENPRHGEVVWSGSSSTFIKDPDKYFMGGGSDEDRISYKYTLTEALVKLLVACALTESSRHEPDAGAILLDPRIEVELDQLMAMTPIRIARLLLGEERLDSIDFSGLHSWMYQSEGGGAVLEIVTETGVRVICPGQPCLFWFY